MAKRSVEHTSAASQLFFGFIEPSIFYDDKRQNWFDSTRYSVNDRTYDEFFHLVEAIEAEPSPKVVTLESTNPDIFIAHYGIGESPSRFGKPRWKLPDRGLGTAGKLELNLGRNVRDSRRYYLTQFARMFVNSLYGAIFLSRTDSTRPATRLPLRFALGAVAGKKRRTILPRLPCSFSCV